MWSAANNTPGMGLNANDSEEDYLEGSQMDLTNSYDMDVASLTSSTGAPYSSSLNNAQPMDLTTSTDENFSSWIDRPGLLDNCYIDPSTLVFQREIGQGAFSKIYLAQLTINGSSELVAVKKLNNKVRPKQGFPVEVLFSREVAYLRLLQPAAHPNIVRFIGGCKTPEMLIVMEFVSGGSLYTLLHLKPTNFVFMHQLRIAVDIAQGMAFLHSNNVLHRDLTSENVLLTQKGVAKLIDFGFALLRDTNEDWKLRPTGNARWRAPEITKKDRYSSSVDVYSYGIIVNEIFSRKPPFDDVPKSKDAAIMATKGNRPAILFDDKELQTLVQKCWHHDPHQRPSFERILQWLRVYIVKKTQGYAGNNNNNNNNNSSNASSK